MASKSINVHYLNQGGLTRTILGYSFIGAMALLVIVRVVVAFVEVHHHGIGL